MPKSLKIHELTPGCGPVLIDQGDWMDLRTARDVEIKAGELATIPLGIAVQLPESYEAFMLPRSSTCIKYGLTMGNSMGVIDNSYCGDNDEWHFLALAFRDTKIPKGTRIAQFRIMLNQPPIEIEYVDHLGNEDRGGLGSTGTK